MSDPEATQTAQPTAGEWTCRRQRYGDGHAHKVQGPGQDIAIVADTVFEDEQAANGLLIATACNAAKRLNPTNPLAAAQSMERVVTALGAFVRAFGPVERKPFPRGLAGTYPSPAGNMIDAEIAERAAAALAAMGQDGAA